MNGERNDYGDAGIPGLGRGAEVVVEQAHGLREVPGGGEHLIAVALVER